MADIFARASELLGCEVVEKRPASGGCIAQAYLIRTEIGNWYFIKTGQVARDSFLIEARGLQEIVKTQAIRTPKVIAAEPDLLLLEAIEPGESHPLFWGDFASQLAALHRTSSESFGFYEDGYLGTTPQPNTPHRSWTEFFKTQRLQFQFDLAERNGHMTSELKKLKETLLSYTDHLLEGISDEAPSLIHGDLWSGNYLISSDGMPVLIDPAVHYAHREAELAMCALFGGFPPEFFTLYHQAYPLSPGWQERQEIYKLYHLLNHLNLFGSSYAGQVVQSLHKIL